MGTHSDKTVSVSNAVVADADLDQTGFEALTFVEVAGALSFPEYGKKANVAELRTYKGVEKGVGSPNFGGGDMECSRKDADAGQVLLNGYANGAHVAFKVEYADGSIDYLRGIVSGPSHPDGGDEDFRRSVYALGFNQAHVAVAAP